ncbi:MAG: hypothetical protein ACE5FJ_01040 [Gemmatimonadales bacterium]
MIIELDDGTGILRCRRACLRRAEQMGLKNAIVWKPHTFDLSEIRITDWGEHDLIRGATVVRTPFSEMVIDIPFNEFDVEYTDWLSARPAFKLN